jgi:hypothetical protein
MDKTKNLICKYNSVSNCINIDMYLHKFELGIIYFFTFKNVCLANTNKKIDVFLNNWSSQHKVCQIRL